MYSKQQSHMLLGSLLQLWHEPRQCVLPCLIQLPQLAVGIGSLGSSAKIHEAATQTGLLFVLSTADAHWSYDFEVRSGLHLSMIQTC